jgi:WD40 repeat protein
MSPLTCSFRFSALPQWDLGSATCSATLPSAHELNITGVASNPTDPGVIFSGSRDYSVKSWDLEIGALRTSYSSPRNIVTTLACCPAQPHSLYQGSEDLFVRVWDTRSSSHSAPAQMVGGYVYFPVSMDVHPGGVLLATGCKGFDSVGCTVKVWDLRSTAKPLFDFAGHSQDVVGCRFSRDLLLSASKDGSLCAWNLGMGNTPSTSLFTNSETAPEAVTVESAKPPKHVPVARNHATGKLITCLAVPDSAESVNSGNSRESEDSGVLGESGNVRWRDNGRGGGGVAGESEDMAFGANDGSVSLARLVSRAGGRSIEVCASTAPCYDRL